MTFKEIGKESGQLITERARLLIAILIDSLFLLVWLGVIRLFDLIADHFGGRHSVEWASARVFISVTTLAVVAMYCYWDLKKAYNRLRAADEALAVRSVNSPQEQASDTQGGK